MKNPRRCSTFLVVCLTGAQARTETELRLGAPPPAPSAQLVEELRQLTPASAASSGPFALNTSSREEVRNFFNTVYAASESVPLGWTGNHTNCNAGTTSGTFRDAVVRRINYFRAMAGVPAGIAFNSIFNNKAQQAALMMSANDALSHSPPSSWSCYTDEGAEAAENSNIALGSAGSEAINGYIHDHSANNTAAGHRRWLLYPQTQVMGTGDVPTAGGFDAANTTWVFDGNFGGPRPAARDTFVSWPPRGFIPYQIVYPRWSFSYPDANFTNATVSMSSNGVSLSVRIEPIESGAGEETLVWVPAGLNANDFNVRWPRPANDTAYNVTIQNVLIGGRSSNFAYTVTIMDPNVPGTNAVLPVISGPAQPSVNYSNRYSFLAVPGASAYQWRVAERRPLTEVDGAENGLTNFVVNTSSGYNVRVASPRASGSWAFHLAHPAPPTDQTLTYRRVLLPGGNSQVRFRSRLGWAASAQVARVQISLNDGGTWQDVYSQAGTGSAGETAFSTRTISLNSFAGRSVMLRFNYDYVGGSYFAQIDSGVGWYLDDVSFTNVEELFNLVIADVSGGTNFSFVPTQTGNFALQARARVFSTFFLEWGPALLVTASTSPPPVLTFAGGPVITVNQIRWDFSVVSYRPGITFDLLKTVDMPPMWMTDPSATFQTLIPSARFRVTATIGSTPQAFYQLRAN